MERTTPPPPGAGLNGSPLVGLLAQLALADRPAAPASFVEGMGRWLGWKEAIPLSAVLQAGAPGPTTPAAPRADTAALQASLQAAVRRVQQQLQLAIADDAPLAQEDGHSFLPFRRRCFSLQQAMDAAVGPLRTQLRAAVARLSPALAQLAALDAVMASTLAPREQAQLAQLPVLLEKHFHRLRDSAQAPGTWLPRFRRDMQQLLQAELDLRLQPALGLLAALQEAQPTSPTLPA